MLFGVAHSWAKQREDFLITCAPSEAQYGFNPLDTRLLPIPAFSSWYIVKIHALNGLSSLPPRFIPIWKRLRAMCQRMKLSSYFSWGLTIHTVDGRNPAPPKKPWNDDSPANTNTPWVSHGFEAGCRPSTAQRSGFKCYGQEWYEDFFGSAAKSIPGSELRIAVTASDSASRLASLFRLFGLFWSCSFLVGCQKQGAF